MTRQQLVVLSLVIAGSTDVVIAAAVEKKRKKNVVFAVFDDLRPNLGCYNNRSFMHTPNIDKLAAESLVFDRAYTNYAYCAPTRNSFMSGRMPDTTKVWNFLDSFRDPTVVDRTGLNGMDWTTLPGHFRKNGYWTVASGKLFHPNHPPDNDNKNSWSVNVSDPGGNAGCTCPTSGVPGAPMYCELPDNTSCPDVMIAETVSGFLRQWNASATLKQQPFFVGVGIHKPHLPWGVPKRFFAQYPPAEELPLAKHPLEPEGMPAVAYHHCQWEPFPWNSSKGIPVAPAHAHAARRGYYAAVTFADSLLGDVLDTLKAIGEDDNTIIMLTSDHGWLLGEHNEWCKETVFELALKIPFIIKVPGPNFKAGRTNAFAENIDIYRTLSDLAELSTPEPGVDGVSLAPLLMSAGGTTKGDHSKMVVPKTAAFAQHAHCLRDPTTLTPLDPWKDADSCTVTPRNLLQYMGYSIRTDSWRYNEWVGWDGETLSANWSAVNATELYDHRGDDGDFDATENVNLANHPKYASVAAALSQALRKHFGGPRRESYV